MAENAVTKQDSPKAPETISQVLQVLVPQLARAVPKGMDPDRIARIVQTEIRKSRNAKAAGIAKQSLDDCTQESFAGALLTSAALGLEPGVNGECYLVPYRDTRRGVVECQLIIGYQGIVKLFW
ncbi:recombinase RecT, partial [Mycobacterium tuberculosis]